MTHQMSLMQCHQQSLSRLPFFKRIGYLELCVLPDQVLDDASLSDPETGAVLPSLRQSATAEGLCYARVIRSCASGLYWAEVSSTPSLADQESVILTEEQLAYALAWDIRLQGKCPAHIRRILFACAQESHQTALPTSHISYEAVIPTPVVPLVVTEPIEVSTNDLHKALTSSLQVSSRNQISSPSRTLISDFVLQQGMLRAMLQALRHQLSLIREQAEAGYVQARCTLVAQMQQWHRKTRQRVVHLARDWSREHRSVVWLLTLGVPESLLRVG